VKRWLEKHKGIIVAVALHDLALAIVVGAALFASRIPTPSPIIISPITPVPTPTRAPTATPGPIQVYVCGAVARPGVYTLPWDARVREAIAAAGSTTSDADLVKVNLSERLRDEQQIYVPCKSEAATPILPTPVPHVESTSQSTTAHTTNINTASSSELEALPGIGPVLAQRILEYRSANGPFVSIEQIKDVKGIGDHTFENIKDMITVE